jgi:hypothetical protein
MRVSDSRRGFKAEVAVLGVSNKRLIVVIQMLIQFMAWSGESRFWKLVAVRYIGGILELPTFWMDENYELQRLVVEKLCEETIFLIDVGALEIGNVGQLPSSDPEGIDILAEAILVGCKSWIRRKLAAALDSEKWLHQLLLLIRALRGYVFSLNPRSPV